MCWGYEHLAIALLFDSGGCFVRLRGCLERSGVVVFYPHPLACEKDHIAPQLCQKKKDTKEEWGWVCVRVSRLSAWRLALKDTAKKCTPLKFLKSSTYNIHFKSYLMLRVLA